MPAQYNPKCHAKPLFSPVEEVTVEEFERTLGTSLPPEYREFLLQWNGASFVDRGDEEYVSFVTFSYRAHPAEPSQPNQVSADELWSMDGTMHTVDFLFGLETTHMYRLEVRDTAYGFDVWAPDRFLSVGENGEGGRVCISLHEPDRGEVFYWSRPTYSSEDRDRFSDMECVSWIAPNFWKFWNLLGILTDDEIDALEVW